MIQQHSIYNRPLSAQTERMILFGLRTVGAVAHIICILYWLSFLLR